MNGGRIRPWRPAPRAPGETAPRRGWGRLRDGLSRSAQGLLGADLLWSAAFVVVVFTLLAGERRGSDLRVYQAGERIEHDVAAPRDMELRDEGLTRERRAAARDAVPDVYIHDAGRASRLAEAFAAEVEAKALADEPTRRALRETFERAMSGLVVANRSLLERQREILVVHVPSGLEQTLRDLARVIDLDAARSKVRAAIAEVPGLEPSRRQSTADLAAGFVDANLAFDPTGTEGRRTAAADAVLGVHVRIPEGTVLAREGEVAGPEILSRLDAARRQATPGLGVPGALGLGCIVVLMAFFLHRYSSYHQRQFRKVRHLHALLVLVLLAMLLVAQGMLWLSGEVAPRFPSPFDHLDAYAYLIPFGTGAILIALLANGRIAMVYATFAALLFGALTGWDAYRATWAILVQWAAVYAITSYRERAALLRAGLVVGLAGAMIALAVEALRHPAEPLASSLWSAALAFVGGAIGVGLLVSFALPILEQLFRVLTDIRLLELSNVNNPLLSQLAVKAPGSYNHSLIVGTLAEEAAKAIGANSLYCRVAAFYHDIGKIRHPEYFVENQRGVNPHDRLSPSMSALIITAHVKDGIRLAREARIPEQIIDIIPQHHGTRVMGYFYEKARKAAQERGEVVHADDFRYPGPKPQSKEAAIFMLADGVEAAARTVEDPNPSRLREVIHKISSAIVLDGQLDACDLTFADLEKIEQAFLRTLSGMYHHRVDYPGFVFGRARAEGGELRAFRG